MALQPEGKYQTQIHAFLYESPSLLSLSESHLKRFSFIQANFSPEFKASRLCSTVIISDIIAHTKNEREKSKKQ
jgi:hypothetical protein